jgi:copper chaperone CopZ
MTDKTDKKFELKVEGMHCGGCVKRVQGALEKLEGVVLEKVDIGKVLGTFDSSEVDVGALVNAVTKAGYPARVAEEG